MTSAHDSPLGKSSHYVEHYDPSLLFPIPRAAKRSELGIDAGQPLPFHGVDIWNAYELSWLDRRGKPRIAIAEFRVPAQSPCIIESKSFKLYLNSYNQTRLASINELRERLLGDLAQAAAAEVGVTVFEPAQFSKLASGELDGILIDDLDIDVDDYGPPDADQLRSDASLTDVDEVLCSNLLKSNCPVTGQPDWASVQIAYRGAPIDHAGLLRYLISFRRHDDFHEQCVERIYTDLMRTCAPHQLSVSARYTRRGGLDINPVRSSHALQIAPPNQRTARQ